MASGVLSRYHIGVSIYNLIQDSRNVDGVEDSPASQRGVLKSASVGWFLPSKLSHHEAVTADGKSIGPEEVGELCISGSS